MSLILSISVVSAESSNDLVDVDNLDNETLSISALDIDYVNQSNELTVVDAKEPDVSSLKISDKNLSSDSKHVSNVSSKGQVYRVSNDDYGDYFDSEGYLKSFINDGDTLIIVGTLPNKGQIILNKKVTVVGDNGKITNTTLSVKADGCSIKDLTIDNSYAINPNCWGIKISEVDNITVTRCNISVRDKNTSYGIYIFSSHGDDISYNNIKSRGDKLTYSIVTYETYDSKFNYNNITSIGTSELHPYEGFANIDGDHIVKEVYRTYALLMVYSSNNKICKNNVRVGSDLVDPSSSCRGSTTNTLVGIDLYCESSNNKIDSNRIIMEADDNYIYGLGVMGSATGLVDSSSASRKNKFINNYVYINGSYMATGLIAGTNAINTLIKNNTFILHSGNYTYGITLEMSQKSNVTYNKLYQYGLYNYGFELFSSNNNNLTHNYLYGGGAFSENMGLYNSKYNVIKYNTLISNGSYNQKSYSIVTKVDKKVFGKYKSLNNWVNSLSKKDYNYILNWFKSGDYKKASKSKGTIKGVSLANLRNWMLSLNSSSTNAILTWIKKPISLAEVNVQSPHKQNEIHPDAVDMWNTNIWLQSYSNHNVIGPNSGLSNSPDSIMRDGSSNNNKFLGGNSFYSSGYSKSSKGSSSLSNIDFSDILSDDGGSNGGSVLVNGSSNSGGRSLDGDSGSLSDVGDALANSKGSSAGQAYELSSSTKSINSTYAIPIIILVMVALFCYGFLRKDENNEDSF